MGGHGRAVSWPSDCYTPLRGLTTATVPALHPTPTQQTHNGHPERRLLNVDRECLSAAVCVAVLPSPPPSPGCKGVEEAMSTMRAGGKRRIIVPPSAGFGEAGSVLRPTEHVPEKQGIIPGGAELEYELELKTVSIPPS